MERQIEGDIALLGVCELLQVAAFNHRSFLLMLDNPFAQGYIVFDDGKVTDAVVGETHGIGALFPLLQGASEGTFRIFPFPEEKPAQTITLKTEAILLRAAANSAVVDPSSVSTGVLKIQGNSALLDIEEILQIFENSKRPVECNFDSGDQGQARVLIAEGGIVEANHGRRNGAEAVYNLLALKDVDFGLYSPASPPVVEKMLDISSVVLEGLRRRDEGSLIKQELSLSENEHAAEILEALDSGELDEPARVELARRYLPGGAIAPASIVARLTVDESETVRKAALSSIMGLPEPVVEALGNDEETPRPLLHFLLTQYKSELVHSAIVANPRVSIDSLIEFAPLAKGAALDAFKNMLTVLELSRPLRAALRANPACGFIELLDKIDAKSAPRMRKAAFKFESDEMAVVEEEIVLEAPEEDPRMEKAKSKPGPKDIQYMAKRGTLRQKIELVCGNDADIAVEIVSSPGLPEVAIMNIAECTSSHPAALTYIAGQRKFRRNVQIIRALVFNPKTPPHASVPLLSLVRVDEINKIATSRDLPDGLRQGARHILDKKAKKKK